MISKPIPYGRQCITDGDIQAVIETLKSDYLTQGPKIKEFEAAFAEYVGAKCYFRSPFIGYCIGCPSR